jgi:16S rRNA (cytosine1402-N4)-methyltransferase
MFCRVVVQEPEPANPTANPASPHRRRARYRGTHPRRFEEKYKELNPDRYAGDVRKIIESGKTPAGSHRPICVREILEILAPKPGEIAVDATLGYGGHAQEIARALLPNGRLYGLDVDPIELPKTEARLRAAGIPEAALVVRRTNFAGLPQLLAGEKLAGVDMVLADLGVSSMQLDDPARGFSFKLDGPLDLRMNPGRGRSAADLLAGLSARDLAGLLEENADESRAELIAGAVCRAQARTPILRTGELSRVIREALTPALRSREEIDAAVRRSFQALRIAVNDEFGALETFLRHLPACLKPGGRVAILTFHSGEDRRVKGSFRDGARHGDYASVARHVIRPDPAEIRSNPRAASAKLRWAVKA